MGILQWDEPLPVDKDLNRCLVSHDEVIGKVAVDGKVPYVDGCFADPALGSHDVHAHDISYPLRVVREQRKGKDVLLSPGKPFEGILRNTGRREGQGGAIAVVQVDGDRHLVARTASFHGRNHDPTILVREEDLLA